ncbi:MAG TPA: hypothetical protein VFA09_01365 [Ktedonobacteraceae bacterium]|jgi:hypothetical protein|nr:hypothetical protein [Ktedonobacteraceae bacterium]HZU65899.1 hypothetical protein [Ktedonobacteraceae bacterium]
MRFRLIVYLATILVIGLLAWQLYGAHHYPNMNARPAVQHVMVVVPAGTIEGLRWG